MWPVMSSTHYNSTKEEALRYLGTNTDKKQFYKMLFHHRRNLLKRGYPRSLINDTMKRVKFSIRELMKPKDKNTKLKETGDRSSSERLTFVTRCCSRVRKVFRIVKRYWSSLQSDHVDINKYIKKYTPMLTFRSNKSLVKTLARAKLKRPHNKRHNNAANSTNHSSLDYMATVM